MGIVKKDSVNYGGVFSLAEQPFIPGPKEQEVLEDLLQGEATEQPLEEEIVEEELDPLEVAKKEAEDIVARAKQEAQDIKDTADSEVDQMREQIKTQAMEEAQASIEEEAALKVEEALSTLNQAVVERKKIIADSENEILRLAVKISEKIIRSEISIQKDVIINMITEAISRISDREQVILRVSKEDVEYVKSLKDRIMRIVDGVRSFSILEDGQIDPGGCIIETNLGFVDARISTKIKTIEEALQKVVHSESEESA